MSATNLADQVTPAATALGLHDLPMMIAMERPDTEIAEAARPTQTALRLAVDLSDKGWSALERPCP